MHVRRFSAVTLFLSCAFAALPVPATTGEPGAGQRQSPAIMVTEDLDSAAAPRGAGEEIRVPASKSNSDGANFFLFVHRRDSGNEGHAGSAGHRGRFLERDELRA